MEKIIETQTGIYVFANNSEYLTDQFTTRKEAIWLLNEELRLKHILFSEYEECIKVLDNSEHIPNFYYSTHNTVIKDQEDYEYGEICKLVDTILLAGQLFINETDYPIFPFVSCIIGKDDTGKDKEIYYLVHDFYKIGVTKEKKHYLVFNPKIITSVGEFLLLIQEFKSDKPTYQRLLRDICSIRFIHKEN